MHNTDRQTEQDRNRAHVESIRDDLMAIYEGRVWRLEDGEEITLKEGEELTEEQEQGAEQVTFWDYFDDVLDIVYYTRGHAQDAEVLGVRLLVAYGGPNIYIDTYRGAIELYWWTDHAECDLWREVCDEIDAVFEEVFNC